MLKRFLTTKLTKSKRDHLISRYASDEKLVLDLGCGDANYRNIFPNRIGLDFRPGEHVDVVADAHHLPFVNNKFDIILCTELLEHLHSPQVAIAEMKRVLKTDGLLILTTRFIFPLHDIPNDYFRFTKYGLRFLFKDGWEILELEEEASTGETLAILLQRIGFQTELKFNFLMKFLIFIFAKIICLMPSLMKKEYGDIRRSKLEKDILTSGYFIVCKKI